MMSLAGGLVHAPFYDFPLFLLVIVLSHGLGGLEFRGADVLESRGSGAQGLVANCHRHYAEFLK